MGESYGPVYFPQADSYVVTAAVDPANDIQESDESDNYATDAVTVP
jgi:subtilase family serine protease